MTPSFKIKMNIPTEAFTPMMSALGTLGQKSMNTYDITITRSSFMGAVISYDVTVETKNPEVIMTMLTAIKPKV